MMLAAIAISAVPQVTASTLLPAPLPEFIARRSLQNGMNRKSKTANPRKSQHPQIWSLSTLGSRISRVQEVTPSYFAVYDPELVRRKSADPRGFPDGANNNRYYSIPTVSFDVAGLLDWQNPKTFDAFGLWYDEHYGASDAAVDFTTASAAVNAFGAAGLTISQRLGDLSLSNDPTDYPGLGSFNNPLYRVSPSDEINLLKSEAAFTDFFSDDFFGGLAQASSNVSLTQRIDYPHGTDAGFSYGRVDFEVSGNFSYSDLGNGWTQRSIDPLFLFDDRYDFNIGSNNPAIQALARLQFHDLIYSFVNSGEWFGSYSGTFE